MKFILIALISVTAWSAPSYKQVNSSIPKTLRERLKLYLSQKREMDVVTATKEGQWILIGRGVRYYSSTSFFDKMKGSGSMPLRKKVNEYMNAGRRIDALGITNGNNWVLTSGNFRYYSSKSEFDKLGVRPIIESLIKRRKKITQISFSKKNAWAIIGDGTAYYSSNAPTDLKKAIIDARQQKLVPRVVKFRPGSEQWIFIAGQKIYSAKSLAKSPLYSWVSKYREFNWEVNEVYFNPNRGWSIISNKTIDRGNTTAENVQWNVANQSIWQRMEYHKATAISVAYIQNGTLRDVRTYGYANYHTRRMAYVDTPFAIASMSKAVGSFSMFHAAQQGIVNVDRSLADYIERNRNNYLGKWGRGRSIQADSEVRIDRVNITRLLTHTAGFNKHGIGVSTRAYSVEDVLDGTWGVRVDFLADAGVIYDYSGGGYTVAESILDNESSTEATNWFNGTTRALSMRDSTFSSMKNKSHIIARLHNEKREVLSYRDCPAKAAGGMFATPKDYTVFLRTLLNGGTTPFGRRVLSQAWNRRMFTPIHEEGSSLASCRFNRDCTGSETCVARRCMVPLMNNSSFVGPGVRLWGPFDATTNMPNIFSHGGAQTSTRTNFMVHVGNREGIVLFVSGEREWRPGRNQPLRGSNFLINEVMASYRNAVGW
jgi:CubicO group peptidase (beta-lactamase class C family)